MPPAVTRPRVTPLHAAHKKLGARLVDFANWLMPLQYSSILEEHHSVRRAAGLFDISHMGQVFVSGTAAEAWLNTMLTNDIRMLSPGEGQYTLMLNEQGGTLDDLLVFRVEDQTYLLVLNAARTTDDLAWLKKWATDNVEITHHAEGRAGLALQGPQAEAILEKVFPSEFHFPPRNEIFTTTYQKFPVLISRTGYTGEDGFEIFCPAEVAEALWENILKAGEGRGCRPAGLGARDSLRLEASLPLYGHELTAEISPLEAGLSFFVAFDKPEKFIGRDALRAQKKSGVTRKLVPFRVTENAPPPRAGYAIHHQGRPVGQITSGLHSPTLNTGIGFALIDASCAAPETPLTITIRDRQVAALTAKRPLYKPLSHENTH